MTIGQISIDKKEKVSVPPPLPLLFKTKTIDFITGTGTYLINYKQINYSLNFQVTGAAAAGKMTVKVKQLSELLAGQPTTADDAAASALADDVRNIFGGGGDEDETFDAMIQRHRGSWSSVNPTDDFG